MIRKIIIVVLTLAAVATSAMWFILFLSATHEYFGGKHFLGFALIHEVSPMLRFFSYRGYPSVSIPIP